MGIMGKVCPMRFGRHTDTRTMHIVVLYSYSGKVSLRTIYTLPYINVVAMDDLKACAIRRSLGATIDVLKTFSRTITLSRVTCMPRVGPTSLWAERTRPCIDPV